MAFTHCPACGWPLADHPRLSGNGYEKCPRCLIRINLPGDESGRLTEDLVIGLRLDGSGDPDQPFLETYREISRLLGRLLRRAEKAEDELARCNAAQPADPDPADPTGHVVCSACGCTTAVPGLPCPSCDESVEDVQVRLKALEERLERLERPSLAQACRLHDMAMHGLGRGFGCPVCGDTRGSDGGPCPGCGTI